MSPTSHPSPPKPFRRRPYQNPIWPYGRPRATSSGGLFSCISPFIPVFFFNLVSTKVVQNRSAPVGEIIPPMPIPYGSPQNPIWPQWQSRPSKTKVSTGAKKKMGAMFFPKGLVLPFFKVAAGPSRARSLLSNFLPGYYLNYFPLHVLCKGSYRKLTKGLTHSSRASRLPSPRLSRPNRNPYVPNIPPFPS